MTLKELLDSGYSGYFYYDSSSLNHHRATVSAGAEAAPQGSKKPGTNGIGVTVHDSRIQVYVNLKKPSTGPYLDKVILIA